MAEKEDSLASGGIRRLPDLCEKITTDVLRPQLAAETSPTKNLSSELQNLPREGTTLQRLACPVLEPVFVPTDDRPFWYFLTRNAALENLRMTTEDIFTQPILNSPYEYPARHWDLDKQAVDLIPTRSDSFEVAQPVLILTRSASEANKLRLAFRVKCLPR